MHPYCALLARLTLGTIWITAGVVKLARGGRQGEAVAAFGLLPRAAAEMAGRGLPWVELVLGALLIVGLGTTAGAACSAALLTVFSLVIAVNLLRGRIFECRCFGATSHAPVSWWAVCRNAGLVVGALIVLRGRSDYLSADGWLRGSAIRAGDPPPLDFVPVALMAIAVAAAWAALSSAWEVAKALASATEGPALHMGERRLLRRLLDSRRNGPAPVGQRATSNGG